MLGSVLIALSPMIFVLTYTSIIAIVNNHTAKGEM